MKRKLVYTTLLLFIATVAVTVCSGGNGSIHRDYAGTETINDVVDDNEDVIDSLLRDVLSVGERYNPYIEHFDSMPPGGRKLRVAQHGVLGRIFRDSNYHHLEEAGLIGITPIECVEDAWNISRPVVMIKSCRNYYVDSLTHSLPFLVPEAAKLLDDIGRSFRDSLSVRGGGDYRVKVTSVLRTSSSVAGLRRRNRNAVERSAHLYGTTFDLSYLKFICDSVTVPRTQEDLKNLLAEIIYDYKSQGRCYVKYERKQSCFHITARSADTGSIKNQVNIDD